MEKQRVRSGLGCKATLPVLLGGRPPGKQDMPCMCSADRQTRAKGRPMTTRMVEGTNHHIVSRDDLNSSTLLRMAVEVIVNRFCDNVLQSVSTALAGTAWETMQEEGPAIHSSSMGDHARRGT